jgi:8-oxo-dGTP pyrophosphatase MutT (NUDIX family)
MRTDNPWKITSSEIVYQNPWIRIHEDKVIMPSGKPGLYAYMESNDSVVIIALDDEQKIRLIRQFSYPVAAWSWRVPQGGGDKQHSLQAAKRELKEEAGIEARTWELLGEFRVCNGLMTERCTAYLATDSTLKAHTDDEEAIDGASWVTMAEADAKIERGDIDDSQSIVAIHLAQKWLAQR